MAGQLLLSDTSWLNKEENRFWRRVDFQTQESANFVLQSLHTKYYGLAGHMVFITITQIFNSALGSSEQP